MGVVVSSCRKSPRNEGGVRRTLNMPVEPKRKRSKKRAAAYQLNSGASTRVFDQHCLKPAQSNKPSQRRLERSPRTQGSRARARGGWGDRIAR